MQFGGSSNFEKRKAYLRGPNGSQQKASKHFVELVNVCAGLFFSSVSVLVLLLVLLQGLDLASQS